MSRIASTGVRCPKRALLLRRRRRRGRRRPTRPRVEVLDDRRRSAGRGERGRRDGQPQAQKPHQPHRLHRPPTRHDHGRAGARPAARDEAAAEGRGQAQTGACSLSEAFAFIEQNLEMLDGQIMHLHVLSGIHYVDPFHASLTLNQSLKSSKIVIDGEEGAIVRAVDSDRRQRRLSADATSPFTLRLDRPANLVSCAA